MSKHIKLYTLNICSLQCVNYTSTKLILVVSALVLHGHYSENSLVEPPIIYLLTLHPDGAHPLFPVPPLRIPPPNYRFIFPGDIHARLLSGGLWEGSRVVIEYPIS